jgi:hypothetical protein
VDTVTVSRSFDCDLEDLVARCRSLDSRRFWPGAVLLGGAGSTLFYQVSMRLKAATMTDIDVEETLSDVVRRTDGGATFTTSQRCTWPDGVAMGETEYAFAPGTLTFTYRYEPPSTKLVRAKQLPAFRDGMQRVCTRYLEGLTATPVRV